ncbi:sensor histidine kinase [Pedobacter mucosus]|uniref:sensor histidine kinase n=1 Tax=Pedobacter mucosus TaxID=2895286 RepID=UPI001EE4541B|nr:PAS domain-containing sensor histidine kinase [Pedobacter mucosus]UKT64773.1 PAS domain-containing sensor histidine kinase [Pedobacter mucosus]
MQQDSDQQIFFEMGKLSKDGYFIFDLNVGSFTYLNSAFCTIFDLERAVIINDPKSLFKQFHKEDNEHLIDCYHEFLKNKKAKKYVFKLALDFQQEKYIKCSIFYLSDNGKQSVSGIVEDITVEMNNKIHIEQINGRKNVTLEVLSHDLKEPLGMIKLTASSLVSRLGKLQEEEFRTSLKFISDMCERNLKLVKSMINHEFLKSAVVAIKKERADLVWEIKDIVRFYSRSHLSEIRTFNFTYSHEKIFLMLDSMKFLQVINNLISNSIKFTSDGGVIGVHAEDRETTVVISVTDNGIGIPQEIRKNLFEHSKEVLRKGLNGEESGGLGMNIIKEIVDLHNGRIWLVSEVGVGTTFYIELPKN